MPGSFSRMYVQIVFAVKHRQCLISPIWEDDLFRYITGIVKNKEQLLLAINGVPDHIHFLIRIKPSCRLSDLIREIKKSTNEFIKKKKFVKGTFSWQEGYGAFTYSYSGVDDVIRYIENQKEHHRIRSFKDEYLDFLKKFKIEYEDEYLFEWID